MSVSSKSDGMAAAAPGNAVGGVFSAEAPAVVAQLFAMFDGLIDAVCLLDAGRRIVRANKAFHEFAEKATSSIIGSNLADVSPALAAAIEVPIANAIGTQRRETSEFSLGDRWHSVVVHPVPEEMQHGCRAMVSLQDITEQKRVEKRLRLLSSALQSAANAVAITNRDGEIIWVNSAFTKMTGYELIEVVGKTHRILKSGRHDKIFYEQLWSSILAGNTWHGELFNQRRDGRVYAEDTTITPVRNPAGEITHFVAIKLDVSERKQTEQQLREQATLLELASEAILVRDMDDIVTFWNRGASRLFGWPAEEAIGRKMRDLAVSRDPEKIRQANEIVRQTGRWHGEIESVVNDRAKIIEANWTLIRDANGNPKSILCIDTDITDRKKYEDQLAQVQRLESLATLVSGIAHDFNNSLMPILGLSEILLTTSGALDNQEEARSAISQIHNAAKDAREIVRRLREFYGPGDPVEMQSVLLRTVVNDAVRLTRPRWKNQAEAEGRPIRIKMKHASHSKLVANERQLREAITNLILNAIDAMPSGGTLAINTGETDAVAIIEVRDFGTGMTEEVRRCCIEPFFTTKGEHGTGLGLSMCHGIIQRHNGSLEIESEIGKGTAIRISLPLPAKPRAHDSAAAVPSNAPVVSANRRALVVDDEATARTLLKILLTKQGYQVELAADGVEALEKVRKHPFDVIITDRAMPRMNGDQFALESKKIAPDTPIFMLTGFGGITVTDQNRPPGVDVVAGKPATSQEIREILDRLILAKKSE